MAIRSPKWLVLAALVMSSPDTPGVYELWDDDELLCVRGTHGSTLRHELVHELLETRAQATHFSWEITFHPDDRERELRKELDLQEAAAPEREGPASRRG